MSSEFCKINYLNFRRRKKNTLTFFIFILYILSYLIPIYDFFVTYVVHRDKQKCKRIMCKIKRKNSRIVWFQLQLRLV